MADAEKELTEALEEAYTRGGREAGYWGNYFLRSVRKEGGLATAKQLLKPSRGVSKGFQALADVGRPDLSVEALILNDPRFVTLFTDEEIAEARRRLRDFPGPASRKKVPLDDLFPEKVDPEGRYREGAVREITVNYYERDGRARAACLKRHGSRCAVCGMSFKERYGTRGEGFIHVHHKKPLAARRESYELDPKKDLVPVCPNCHAMLHTVDPPLSVDELRRELEGLRGRT
jgi:5-methylcytosine-specific restriction protein A